MNNQNNQIGLIANRLSIQYDELREENKALKAEIDRLVQTKVRPEVQWFAGRMEKKLRENDHKQHWSRCHPDYLIERLYQEASELWEAIRNKHPAESIIDEAADVANFAMMVADTAEKIQQSKELSRHT